MNGLFYVDVFRETDYNISAKSVLHICVKMEQNCESYSVLCELSAECVPVIKPMVAVGSTSGTEYALEYVL